MAGTHHLHSADQHDRMPAAEPLHLSAEGQAVTTQDLGLLGVRSRFRGLTLSNSADKDTLFSLTVQNHITAHTSVSHLGKMKLH